MAAGQQFERALVTGGAGFVGSHLVAELLGSGTEVAVLDDLSRGRREWAAGATVHVVDVRRRDEVAAVVREVAPDLVVHLAALHFIPAVDDAPELAQAINVGGTQAVLDALAGRPPRRLVFASTAAVYPLVRGPIGESVEPGPIDLYGRTKLAGERLVSAYGAEHGVDVVLARLFNVVGRRETNPHVVPEIIGQIAAGADTVRLGSLEPRRDYVDAADVAGALAHLAATSPPGTVVVNVGTGVGTSVAELVAACSQILGRSLTIEVDPDRVRAVDRPVLVADVRRLAGTGWSPAWTIEQTLRSLLVEAGAIPGA